MIQDHPAFPNPTIREALCEIHFALPEGVNWDASFFGALYQAIQPDFPRLEPVASVGLQVQLASGKVGLLPPQSRMRYAHRERNLLVQLSEGILTVNVLPRYEGWTQMRSDILWAWEQAAQALSPAGITRIGLRYINTVPKVEPDDTPGDWFARNEYTAAAVLASGPGLLSRCEVHHGLLDRSVVTLGEAIETSGYVLDIDRIREGQERTYLALEPTLSVLHDSAWSIFTGFISPRLTVLLEGGVP